MILHTINSSPYGSLALQDCLQQIAENDFLLLLGDAVVASSIYTESQPTLLKLHASKRLFVLQVDLQARGVVASYGECIDYSAFVELSIQCQSQLAW